MGHKSHKSMPFMCGACKAGFGTIEAVKMHARDAHAKTKHIGIYRCVTHIDGKEAHDEPSMAEMAIEASLARDLGEPHDYDWLLP
jgi:hypothetical protein